MCFESSVAFTLKEGGEFGSTTVNGGGSTATGVYQYINVDDFTLEECKKSK